MGRWSEKDKARLRQNLEEFEEALAMSTEDVLSILDNSSLSDVERRMKKVVGFWCSRELSHIRDPCEVFQMLRKVQARYRLVNINKGLEACFHCTPIIQGLSYVFVSKW